MNMQITLPHPACRCLVLLGQHHGVEVRVDDVTAALGATADPKALVRAAMAIGLTAKITTPGDWAGLKALARIFPAVAWLRNGNAVVVAGFVPGDTPEAPRLMVLDPLMEDKGLVALSEEQFCDAWSGDIILIGRKYRLDDENQPFGLRWFIPEILRQGSRLRDVIIAALLIHVVSFGTPLLFQIVIDKVVPHQSMQTLFVVILAFAVCIMFEAMFSFLRQHLMIFATNRIDARLVSRTFAHLLSLPMTFFEATTAGVLTKHLQQTEKIRQFLTGRLFQTMLDAAALPALLVILTLYSGRLTLLVLGFSSLIALVIGFLVPIFRDRLKRLYEAEGIRQAHLVEVVHGMRTVKSLALEVEQKKSWDRKLAQSVQMNASVSRLSANAHVVTDAISKLMQVAIIGYGAMSVFDGSLSIGALVAFNMLAGRVTGPLVQIVGLINEYQEAAMSVAMLGNIMNHPPERPPGLRMIKPPVKGRLEFDNVSFTYPGSAVPALDRVSFTVEPGQVIGVVGRSGSGKTTLTRLIQSIQVPSQGLIHLDGIDLRQIEPTHLRRNIGVVLQENFLFRGTVGENIAATRPTATPEEIIAAARKAGAMEFIERLPQALDTLIEENGANFSGGQRQRLAIARALMARPPMLIFDEATSALDPETEAIIETNMEDITMGRTMVIVSHRLSSLVRADAILMLEQGKVMDFAPHETLLARCAPYQRLWQQQTRHMA